MKSVLIHTLQRRNPVEPGLSCEGNAESLVQLGRSDTLYYLRKWERASSWHPKGCGGAGSGAGGWEETHSRAGGCAMCELFQTLWASCQGPGSSGSLWNLDLGQFSLKGIWHQPVITINKHLANANHMPNAGAKISFASFRLRLGSQVEEKIPDPITQRRLLPSPPSPTLPSLKPWELFPRGFLS